jgi:hypothetical protein
MIGLKSLLKEREANFRDHIENRRKKFIVALKCIFHPFTLLTLLYVALLIYNTKILNDGTMPSLSRDSLVTQHIITIVIVLALVIIDVYLKI